MQTTNVEAWTSTVEADIFQNGQIISKRMDVLLGSSLGSCKGKLRLQRTTARVTVLKRCLLAFPFFIGPFIIHSLSQSPDLTD